ncbi:hypothetical protein GTZ97_00885 [Aquabacterium fontiphilum]|uniref:hypothetical protein n=1 Tax=Aquabacterium fontiphilum TaxID=450365 RepID=UPI001378875B|nr:hypothetical protein [Aquabacterium fontiphilum]NBD19225.1 hypothetical protein [Aquabacterium fontiphilum]
MVTLPAPPARPSFAVPRSASRQPEEVATPAPEAPANSTTPAGHADWLSAAMAAWLAPASHDLPPTQQAGDR